MKNCILTLLLSAALALPGFAQQSSSNSNSQLAASASQTASRNVTATGKEPLATQAHDFWDGDDPGIFWLVMHPFASKSYVRRHVQPIQDRVSELDELTASNSKMIRDVDASAQQGIQLASAKTNMADTHALDAATKAQTAQQSVTDLNAHLSTSESAVGNIDQYGSAAQTEIRFRSGQTALSKQAKDALDQIAVQLKDQHRYIIEVQGFSSGQGQAAIANSRNMASAVERYLVLNHEIPAYRIYVIGMGNAAAERSSRSRVEVSVLKNDLAQTAKQ